MNNSEKRQVAEKLSDYCSRFGSRNRAAASLKGVSSATVTQVLNDNWEQIADSMWRNIASQIGYTRREWNGVETTNYRILHQLLTDAQNDAQVFAVVDAAGAGKSFACRRFAESGKNVYMLTCAEYWDKKRFLRKLLETMGKECSDSSIGEMMETAISELLKRELPLIILDEADKLEDHVLHLFITLYNRLEDRCGIVLCATNFLSKRIRRGVSLNKKGYNEIHSRLGRNCIQLNGVSAKDITSVCVANGVSDREKIREVIDDSEGDLRRVRRKIYALLKSV
jgi:DNA transposition AAA+ family ATPase